MRTGHLPCPRHPALQAGAGPDGRAHRVADIPSCGTRRCSGGSALSTKGNYQNGCMQDIHWTDGSFGYFPSYTLGAMYAAQLRALERELGDMGTLVESGRLPEIFGWLGRHIWSQGSLHGTDEAHSPRDRRGAQSPMAAQTPRTALLK